VDEVAAVDFIVRAKRSTYAAGGDAATVSEVLVPGSKQLEFAEGDWLYRDIYTGFRFFAGQETVYHRDAPVWTMVYCGGVGGAVAEAETHDVYRFLREALSRVDPGAPYRGPRSFANSVYEYDNSYQGSPRRFRGREGVHRDGREVYGLDYCGGALE